MKPWLSLALIVVASACGEGTDPPPTENRYFEDPLPNCPQNDPLINCAPSIELCLDGSAIMLVTDVVNGGSYTETDGVVTATFGAGDVPDTIVFVPSEDDSALVDDWIGAEWQRSSTQFSSCD